MGEIKKANIPIRFLNKSSVQVEKNAVISDFNDRHFKILIINDIKMKTDRYLHPSHFIFYNFTFSDPKVLEQNLHGMSDLKEVIFLATPAEIKQINMIKENIKVSIEKSDYPNNEEISKGYIKSILEKI